MPILIIEDDIGLAELISEKVEESGYKTVILNSAGEAMEWLSSNVPFIILLDYTLPDMNAKEFIEELMRRKFTVPPFIISTGQGDERIAVEMMKLGARDYIVKDSQFLDMLPEIMRRTDREIRNERKVEEQNQRLENVIEGTRLGTWEWNVQTGETIFNERWAEIIGYTLDELAPVNIDTWMKHTHPDDLEVSKKLLRQHFCGELEYYESECRMRHKDGSWVWILDRGKVIEWSRDKQPVRMFGIHMDITEKKEMYKKIEELSIRDPLTNLYNRRYIFERLEEFVSEFYREKNAFTVSIIDIDHFKKVNDRYGHMAGDLVLKEFAEIISSSLRPYDLSGRYGGEEFIIISLNVSREQTEPRIISILEQVRDKTFLHKEDQIKVSFSCGVSCSKEFENLTLSAIIECADNRLYAAKKAGRNRVVIRD